MDAEKYITLKCISSAVAKSRNGTSGTGSAGLQQRLLRWFSGLDGRKTSYIIAAGVNAFVVGYIAHRLYHNWLVQLEQQQQLKQANNRLWELATQGLEAAGAIPDDLGEPDEHGIYTHSSSSGDIYFRQSHRGYGLVYWEFSTDKVFWIPAYHADSLWYSSDSCPSTADKVLIQRLEVETQLVGRQASGRGSNGGSSSTALPELDLSQAVRDITQLSQVPAPFLCPISMQIMTQPVVSPGGGTYNRPALMDWIRQHHTDPVTGAPLRSDQVFPNLAMRDMIHAWAHGCDMYDSCLSSSSESGRGVPEGTTSAGSSSYSSSVASASSSACGPSKLSHMHKV